MNLYRIVAAGVCLLAFVIFAPLSAVAAKPKAKSEAKPAEPVKEPSKPNEQAKSVESPKNTEPAKSLAKVTAPVTTTQKAPALPSSTMPNLGGRSPFAVPHRYTNAVQSLVLRGVVRTAQYSGAILQVGEYDQPVVLRVGSRFKLDLDDQRYEFRLSEIKEKSVVLKGKDDKSYEVPIQ